jgi:type III secretion protein D
MKRLRILTGHHVGAHLDLAPGTHLIGAQHGCDVTITDWTFAPLHVDVGDASVTCRWPQGTAHGDGRQTGDAAAPDVERRIVLDDFEPREFDGIVLCFGPTQHTWPSDVRLLSQVFAPASKRAARWARKRMPNRLLPIGLGAAMLTAALVGWVQFDAKSSAPPLPTINESRQRMQQALERVAAGHFNVRVEQHAIVVTGMADTQEQASAGLAAITATRGPYLALPRYAVASDIAETIRGTTGLTNAHVTHVGAGVFNVVAEVTDERAARAALDRMSADLAPAVKQITASLEKIYPKDPLGPILSSSQQDGLSVVQTRDGVKHLVMLDTRNEERDEHDGAIAAIAVPVITPALKGKTR